MVSCIVSSGQLLDVQRIHCTYICSCTYISIHLQLHIHFNTFAVAHTFQYICSCTYISVRLQLHILFNIFAVAHTFQYICSCSYISIHLQLHIHFNTFAVGHTFVNKVLQQYLFAMYGFPSSCNCAVCIARARQPVGAPLFSLLQCLSGGRGMLLICLWATSSLPLALLDTFNSTIICTNL